MFFNYKTVKTILFKYILWTWGAKFFVAHAIKKNHSKILIFKKVISNLIKKQKQKLYFALLSVYFILFISIFDLFYFIWYTVMPWIQVHAPNIENVVLVYAPELNCLGSIVLLCWCGTKIRFLFFWCRTKS